MNGARWLAGLIHSWTVAGSRPNPPMPATRQAARAALGGRNSRGFPAEADLAVQARCSPIGTPEAIRGPNLPAVIGSSGPAARPRKRCGKLTRLDGQSRWVETLGDPGGLASGVHSQHQDRSFRVRAPGSVQSDQHSLLHRIAPSTALTMRAAPTMKVLRQSHRANCLMRQGTSAFRRFSWEARYGIATCNLNIVRAQI